jgi:osmotically-inducible protein OsmY
MKNGESSSFSRLQRLGLSLIAILAVGGFVAVAANAEEPASSKSLSVEQEHLKTVQKHHYDSPADRAQDALLITEVKSVLAEDGVADGHAVEVDCDHGRVRLSGAVDSAADAKHAEQLASSVQGVSGVDNRLIWR